MRIDIKDLGYDVVGYGDDAEVFPKIKAEITNKKLSILVSVKHGFLLDIEMFSDGEKLYSETESQTIAFDELYNHFLTETKFETPLPTKDFLFEMVGQSYLTEGETEVIEFEDLEEFEMGGLWRINKLIKRKINETNC